MKQCRQSLHDLTGASSAPAHCHTIYPRCDKKKHRRCTKLPTRLRFNLRVITNQTVFLGDHPEYDLMPLHFPLTYTSICAELKMSFDCIIQAWFAGWFILRDLLLHWKEWHPDRRRGSHSHKLLHRDTHTVTSHPQSHKDWPAVSHKIMALAGVLTKPRTLHAAHIFHHLSLPWKSSSP